MRSPTSSEDSRLVKIVVPCAQTRLPGPRGHRDAFSSSSERRKRRAFRLACSAGHRASSEARDEVCSYLSVVGSNVRTERERCHSTLACFAKGCGLCNSFHLHMRTVPMDNLAQAGYCLCINYVLLIDDHAC